MTVQPYSSKLSAVWDEAVRQSKNGTLLFLRSFMDYHSQRFQDASLLFWNEKGHLRAVLPANWVPQERTVYSHQGLTYGGLVMPPDITALEVEACLNDAIQWFKQHLNAVRMVYKPVPYIYSIYPSEEDLYGLFRLNATLVSRGLSTTVDLKQPLPWRTLRKRGINKAQKSGCTLLQVEGQCNLLNEFWNILNEVLTHQHNTHPVHSVAEMALLMERHPQNIKLYGVMKDGKMVAGTWLFITGHTVHAQYIAASPEGKQCGALDFLFHAIIQQYSASHKWLDFGISTEQGGSWLNEGLQFQKEGFGGRGICYDAYCINLEAL